MTLSRVDTARLRLRPFTLDDIDAYHRAIFSDPDVMRYLPGGKPLPVERVRLMINRVRAHWAEHGYGLWAVELRGEGILIGHCGLQNLPDAPEVELAYGIARPYWGRGLVTEAARASVRFGFEHAQLDHIIAVAVPEHAASRRVMEKIGMVYDGTGTYYGTELVRYVLRRADYRQPAAPYTLTELPERARPER